MRLRDFADYWRLRKFLRTPWAFLRLRKKGFPEPWRDFELKAGGFVRVRNAPMDMHIMHRVLGRDEYRLGAFPPGSLGTVVDADAHLGFFAIRVAGLARRVLSYEPFDENFTLLSGNVASFPNVVVLREAIGTEKGERDFHVSAIPSANTFYPVDRHPFTSVVRVRTVALGDVFQEHRIETCDLLKVDVEGAEYPILYGVPSDLWPRIRRICLEYDPVQNAPAGWTGEALEAHLKEAGYRVLRAPSKHPPGKGHLWAVRKEEPPGPWC